MFCPFLQFSRKKMPFMYRERSSHISQLVKVCVRLTTVDCHAPISIFAKTKKWKTLPWPNHVFIQVGQIRFDFDFDDKRKKNLFDFDKKKKLKSFALGGRSQHQFRFLTFCTLTFCFFQTFSTLWIVSMHFANNR